MKLNLLSTVLLLSFSILTQVAFAQDTIVKNTIEADSLVTKKLTLVDSLKTDSSLSKIMSRGDSIIQLAETLIGIPYKYGSIDPKVGFDCSGFVNYVFTDFKISVPRSSKYFPGIGESVSLKDCKPGDIIIFAGYNKVKRPVGHVGIVYSNIDGTVLFLHSASSKKRGVVKSNYTTTAYYNTRFVGIVRKLK